MFAGRFAIRGRLVSWFGGGLSRGVTVTVNFADDSPAARVGRRASDGRRAYGERRSRVGRTRDRDVRAGVVRGGGRHIVVAAARPGLRLRRRLVLAAQV